MLKTLFLALSLTLSHLSSLPSTVSTKDEEVRAIFSRLEKAWNAGDGKAWADCFAEDADFTVWTGLRIKGRDAIREGHDMIFKGPYKGTKLVVEFDTFRWIRSDVALVLTKSDTPGGKKGDQMKQTLVISKHGKEWLVDAFQNTKVQEFRPPNGG